MSEPRRDDYWVRHDPLSTAPTEHTQATAATEPAGPTETTEPTEITEGNDLVRPLPGQLGVALQENLRAGETIEISLHLSRGQALAVTDQRVMLIKAGLSASSGPSWGGRRVKTFPFTQISSVDLRIGRIGGHLQISVAGTVEANEIGEMLTGLEENVVTFQQAKLTLLVQQAAELIRKKVQLAQERPRETRRDAPDIVSRLAELVRLRQQGFLNEDEFAQAKARLLRGE